MDISYSSARMKMPSKLFVTPLADCSEDESYQRIRRRAKASPTEEQKKLAAQLEDLRES